MIRSLLFVCSALLFCSASASAQYQSTQMSVSVEAVIQEAPPSITLKWTRDDSAQTYTVYRMNPGTGNWDKKATLGNVDQWKDINIQAGVGYEYNVTKQERLGAASFKGYGYVYTGINLPAPASSGTVELIVDDSVAPFLSSELTRLHDDLLAEGWKVVRHDVSRSGKVTDVRATIQADYGADNSIRSVFLFGHVPVPYSGQLNPDGHPNHLGAWPADVYYADMSGDYTDDQVKTTPDILPANSNVPGDGKFDQTFPAYVDLEIGRVDMWGMTIFPKSEVELLRQYLNKDHAFRTGMMTAPDRAIVSDNFGTYGEGFACDAWRNYPNFVGASNITPAGWFTTLDTAAYLWAYGCGGGTPTSAGGIGSTSDFTNKDTKAIFTEMFGSYFGDWNVENDFLRAPLTSSMTLTCCWAGRPHWALHHMAMGNTIGFSTRLSQNNQSTYDAGFGAGGVHIALMGDPTLRMRYGAVTNVSSLTATPQANRIGLKWNATAGADGFDVYRMHHYNDVYQLVNASPITGTTYIDSLPFSDSNFYIVRPIQRTQNTHGSYYALGAATPPVTVALSAAVSSDSPEQYLRLSRDGALLNIAVGRATSDQARLALYDLKGNELRVIVSDMHESGIHHYRLNLNECNLRQGVYFVRLLSNDQPTVAKFVY